MTRTTATSRRFLQVFPGRRRVPGAFLRIAALTGLAALMVATPAAAMDWGGSLSSSTTIRSVESGSDAEAFTNTERLEFFLNTPLGSRWSLEGQAAARLDANPLLFAADVERLYFQRVLRPGQGSLTEFVTRWGRQRITDPGGLVVRQVVDGASMILRYPRMELGFSAGYTGFVNKEFTSASMSLRDSGDATDSDVYFGPARLVAQGRAQMRNVVAGQNLTVAFTYQDDLRDPETVVRPGQTRSQVIDDDDLDFGGLLDTQYLQLLVDGPLPTGNLPGNLFYQAAYVLNTGSTLSLVADDAVQGGRSYQYQPILAHLVKLETQYFLPRVMGTAAGLSLTFSTGDSSYDGFTEGNTSGTATMFTPVTPGGAGTVFGLDSGNATIVEIFYSVRPLQQHASPFLNTMQVQAGWFSFFRSAGEGPVSSPSIDAERSAGYLGSEVDLAVRVRPFSDFGFGISGGVFFANKDVLVDGANAVDYLVRLDASLSF